MRCIEFVVFALVLLHCGGWTPPRGNFCIDDWNECSRNERDGTLEGEIWLPKEEGLSLMKASGVVGRDGGVGEKEWMVWVNPKFGQEEKIDPEFGRDATHVE